jgi:hypothetical protein
MGLVCVCFGLLRDGGHDHGDALGRQLLALEKLQVQALSASTFLTHDELRSTTPTRANTLTMAAEDIKGKKRKGMLLPTLFAAN